MIVLLLAEALRSRRGLLRVGNVPHTKRILGALGTMVNALPCPGSNVRKSYQTSGGPAEKRGRRANSAFSARLPPHLSGGVGGFFPPFEGAGGGNRSRLRRGTTSDRMSWNRDDLSSR